MSYVELLNSITKVNNQDLFVIELDDGTSIHFVLPSFKQAQQIYRVILAAQGDASLQNNIFEYIFKEYVQNCSTVLNDEGLPAGIVPSVAEAILFLSGVGQADDYTEELLALYRNNSNIMISFMKRQICFAFSAYKMRDLDRLNYQELIELFVQAERLLIERNIIKEEFAFSKPEEEQPVKSIGEIISNDIKEYSKFEQSTPQINSEEEHQMYRQMQRQRRRPR